MVNIPIKISHYKGGLPCQVQERSQVKGEYTCDNCGQVVVLDDDTGTMPPCPKCSGTHFH